MAELTIEGKQPLFDRLGALLGCELAPFPGRMDAVARYVLSCAIVIVTSMTLQVPFLALSIIMVFFTGQENTFLTRKSGVGLIIGTTLAVSIMLLVLKYTMGYPLPRIACACLVCFAGLYFMRISKLGAIGSLTALLTVQIQSLVDVVNNPEALTRSLLWLWVAISYPVITTIIVNILMRPAHPHRLLVNEAVRQLDVVREQLQARQMGDTVTPLRLDLAERGFLTLHRNLVFATMSDKRYAAEQPRFMMRVNTIDRLHAAAAHLSRWPVLSTNAAQRQLLDDIGDGVRRLEATLQADALFEFHLRPVDLHAVESGFDALLHEMAHAMHALSEAEQQSGEATPAAPEPSIVPDAFTNPLYARSALRTVFAAMICYVFYIGVQWPGISTSMLTCIILALPSLGAASHKGLLRIVGCVLGSIVSLWATVFIVPQLESITGLLMLTLPVIAAGAYIAAGPPRTNYIGVQFVFAFALALLGRFGPTTDLTEIRDRVVGVLLGVFVSLAVSSLLWPEREGGDLRTNLAKLIESIAQLLRAGGKAVESAANRPGLTRARTGSMALLARNRELQTRVALEPTWLADRNTVTLEAQTLLADAQETLFSVDRAQTLLLHAEPTFPRALAASVTAFRAALIQRLEVIATQLGKSVPLASDQSVGEAVALVGQQIDAINDGSVSPQLLHDLRTSVDTLGERVARLATHLERTVS